MDIAAAMNSLPLDYRDELQAIYDFISETQRAPENFHSFHWMISTDERQRFAASSAISGGAVDMSPIANPQPTLSAIRGHMGGMLLFPHVYAVDMRLDADIISPRDVLAQFQESVPDKLLAVVASGRRLSEASGWSLNMVFVGLDNPERFARANWTRLATTKPLVGTQLYSKRERSGS